MRQSSDLIANLFNISHESFTLMADFVSESGDSQKAVHLAEALARTKPFRQFKDEFFAYPELRDAWFDYEQAAYMRFTEERCEENRIKATWA